MATSASNGVLGGTESGMPLLSTDGAATMVKSSWWLFHHQTPPCFPYTTTRTPSLPAESSCGRWINFAANAAALLGRINVAGLIDRGVMRGFPLGTLNVSMSPSTVITCVVGFFTLTS